MKPGRAGTMTYGYKRLFPNVASAKRPPLQ
jgi:hypothetical protein